jgi:hypothetical protein
MGAELILMEEQSLGVSENRVMRGICGTMRERVIGGWRKLYN